MSAPALLEVRGLTTEFKTDRGWRAAVHDLDITVHANETLALVGESGSGKSVAALSMMRLLPEVGARIRAGSIRFEGEDLAHLSEQGMARLRGNRLAMVFQEPMTALNPTMTVGNQIAEPLIIHRGLSRDAARTEALRLMDAVRIPSATRRLDDYPHQFSGGMRQRVVIAIAIACKPRLLIADEPTTALDVTVQAQVLALLRELKAANDMAMVFITHNLGVVAEIADRVAVLYAGSLVEEAPVEPFFAAPGHPYASALMRSVPRSDRAVANLSAIPGSVPSIREDRIGCAYASRCDQAIAACHTAMPPLAAVGLDRTLRCPVLAGGASG
jgi:oligopeptide/dipeptide ABC transporter ATP-binding protein